MHFHTYAQLVWNKSYGTSDFDYPRQIIRLRTGGFLFCGDNNGSAGYLAKINSDGDSLWTKRIFPIDTDKTVRTNTVYQINSNSFIIGGGGSKNLAPNTSYGCLWNIDSNGNVLWYRKTSNLIVNILDLRNGQLICTDYNKLTRIDTLGNVIWSVSFGQYINHSNVLKTLNNTYCFLYHDSLQQIHLKEVSENGIVLRDNSLPFLNIRTVYGFFIQDSMENFIVATDEGAVTLRKFNYNLDLIWKKVYSMQFDLYALLQATNKDYVIVGESHETGDAEVCFIRVNENGDYKAFRIFGPLNKFDGPRDACADSDGGVVIFGYFEDGPFGGYDYLLVKTIVGVSTGVSNEEKFKMSIYPNPTRGEFSIEYELNLPESVEIILYDSYGRSVYTLKSKSDHEFGHYKLTLNTKDISPGVYYCVLRTNSFIQTKELVFID